MGRCNKAWRPATTALLAGLLLVGCAEQQTLYQWEGYQQQVYQYLQGGSKEEQVEVLEADLQKIKAKDGAVPPGYHAQLGLLYSSLGKEDQMIQQFQTEKALFPESATYMDFLLNNAKKGGQQ
jgi:hypothetical protein